MKHRRGDTLIEVALAIGIFSLVAITVVSVISASTSGAQSSLEVTLTREELDGQAEALRFIHDSYVNGSQSADTTRNNYAELWNEITKLAVEGAENVVSYNPATCDALYDGRGEFSEDIKRQQKPFIIDIRTLNNPSNVGSILYEDATTYPERVFYPPSTYPRIYYGGDESLYSQTESSDSAIRRVEGMFITAVKNRRDNPTYYDFYIRSCWMPLNSDRASTISTVIRLYEPRNI